MTLTAFDVRAWIEQSVQGAPFPHMHHHTYYDGGLQVKLFNGATPDDRADFHINTVAEFFFQLKGETHVRTLERGRFRDVTIGEGQMYCVPPMIAHRNRRPQGSLGIVIHGPRAADALDSILWYCEACGHLLHRVDYRVVDSSTQVRQFVAEFLAEESRRTCPFCAAVMPSDWGRMDRPEHGPSGSSHT